MSTVEHARRVVAEHLLSAGDEIESVREGSDGVLVESHEWRWRMTPAPVSTSDWKLYDVELDLFTDPPMAPYGFAVDTDGRVLRLDDRPGLSEFFRLVGMSLAARDIASLLTRYHGGPAHLLDDVAELDRVVGPGAAAGIDGLTAPVTETKGSLAFCTWRVDADDTIAIDRWDVHLPEWEKRTLANRLPWRPVD
ncbi:hypothetical protein ACFWIW_21300 [Amycolatopsis sp. NPDC058340]|uniref:hypothetical protein n=1 Tax=Amycolatopsis sp. NPDC058340 TaxID=3346453 RepID=UPI0036518FC4